MGDSAAGRRARGAPGFAVAIAQVPDISPDFIAQKALTGPLKSRRVPAEKKDAESCLEVGPLLVPWTKLTKRAEQEEKAWAGAVPSSVLDT